MIVMELEVGTFVWYKEFINLFLSHCSMSGWVLCIRVSICDLDVLNGRLLRLLLSLQVEILNNGGYDRLMLS